MTAIADETPKPKGKPAPIWWRIFRDVVAASIWIGLITKLFFFDFDTFAAAALGSQVSVLVPYRLAFYLGIIAIAWLILGNQRFVGLCGWVAFFPITSVFRALWPFRRRWPVLLAFLPVFAEMRRRFKGIFIMYTFALIAGILILAFAAPSVLLLAMTFLMVFLVLHLFSAFCRTYNTGPFVGLAKFAKKVRQDIEGGILERPPLGLAKTVDSTAPPEKPLTPEEAKEKERQGHFRLFYLCNWGFEWLSEKLHDVATSWWPMAYVAALWLYTLALSILVFGLEYLGLFKISPASFSGVGRWPFLELLGLSASRMTASGISPVKVVDGWSQALSHAQSGAQVFVVIILIVTLLTAYRERYQNDISTFVAELRAAAKAVENRLLALYQLTFANVEIVLVKTDKPLIKFARKMRGLPDLEIAAEDPQHGPSSENCDDGA